jgi:hypothetical protein
MKIPTLSNWRTDQLWDTVCFVGCDGQRFMPRDVQDALVRYHGWKKKTAELSWNKFKLWALANPNEFYGPASRLVKDNGGYKLQHGCEL